MQTLSKEAENKVILAVKQAVTLVDEDEMSPVDAIEKIARDSSWGPDMVRFASYAYNTGRQTYQRQENDNALEKFADFPLADPDQVIDRIWPKQVKTAADEAYATVSNEYGSGPAFFLDHNLRQPNVSMIKAASIQVAGLLKTADHCKECHRPMEHCTCPKKSALSLAMGLDEKLTKQAADARVNASDAYQKLIGAMGELGDYFRQSPERHLPFALVEKTAEVYHGANGQAVMDWVFTRNKMAENSLRGDSVNWGKQVVAVEPQQMPWSALTRCVKLAKDVIQFRNAEAAAKTAAEIHKQDILGPLIHGPVKDASFNLLTKSAATPIKLMDMVSDAKNLFGEVLNPFKQESGDPVAGPYEELEDPRHAAKLQQIQTQSMLSDMMNDPVIGGHEPDEVLHAYNEISRLTPRAASQPALMRSHLQRYLQGNVQPFEHGQMLDLEKGLKDTQPAPVDPMPKPAAPQPGNVKK